MYRVDIGGIQIFASLLSTDTVTDLKGKLDN